VSSYGEYHKPPLSAQFASCLRGRDRFLKQHLRTGAAAVPVSVDPVTELGALVTGSVLVPDGECGESIADGQDDRVAGIGVCGTR
jgi:hypothetical protein